VSHETGATG